jgi:hemerythrin-like metal-binding protein
MASLEWSDALSLELPLMDDTHREFVELLAQAEAAPPQEQQKAWQTLVQHTQEHFDREDRWMEATRFASSNCHSVQHKVVLDVLREVGEKSRTDESLIPAVAIELGRWFIQHAQSMDAALALHLRRVGYDSATGTVANPLALPETAITGCGSAACATAEH